MKRFFIPEPLLPGARLPLCSQESHHALHVMRLETGTPIEIVNGRGGSAQALLQKEKKSAYAYIQSVEQHPAARCRLIIAQAIPKANRLDIILEKGTELGMDELWLFPAIHGVRHTFSTSQKERMDYILINAMKQCGSFYLPTIHYKEPIALWEKPRYPLLFGDLSPQAPSLLSVLASPPSTPDGVVFIVGPEGGLAQEELISLKNLEAQGVRLHNHILRTETAPLAALSILACRLIIDP